MNHLNELSPDIFPLSREFTPYQDNDPIKIFGTNRYIY